MRLSTSLIGLGIASIIPLLTFSVIAIWLFDRQQQAALDTELNGVTRSILVAVDRELANQVRPLELLAALPLPERHLDRVEALYGYAVRAVPAQEGWLAVGLIDPSGETFLFHSQRPLGTTDLPHPDMTELTRRAVATKRPVIGGVLARKGLPGGAGLIIRAPVMDGDRVAYVLSLAIKVRTFSEIITRQNLPASWVTAIIDPNRVIAGRSRDAERFVGQPVTDSLAAAPAPGAVGMFRATTKDGDDVYTLRHTSAETGWSVAVGVPAAEIDTRLARVRWTMIGGGTLAVLATGGLVFLSALSWGRRRKAEDEARQAREDFLSEQRLRLLAEKESAQAENKAKSDFLSRMSHELRTPLNAIIGFSETLRHGVFGQCNSKCGEYLTDIHRSGQHLLSLVNDILDIAKIEAGKTDLARDDIDLGDLIGSAVDLVRNFAERNAVAIEVRLGHEPQNLTADALRIRQVLVNILSNAIKFTPAGGSIRITTACRPDGVAITVRDTGIGMSADGIGKALEPFGQVENEFSRRYDGTGLGLPLAKELVELHGGRVDITSEPGCGTTVVVILPAGNGPIAARLSTFAEASAAHGDVVVEPLGDAVIATGRQA